MGLTKDLAQRPHLHGDGSPVRPLVAAPAQPQALSNSGAARCPAHVHEGRQLELSLRLNSWHFGCLCCARCRYQRRQPASAQALDQVLQQQTAAICPSLCHVDLLLMKHCDGCCGSGCSSGLRFSCSERCSACSCCHCFCYCCSGFGCEHSHDDLFLQKIGGLAPRLFPLRRRCQSSVPLPPFLLLKFSPHWKAAGSGVARA